MPFKPKQSKASEILNTRARARGFNQKLFIKSS